MKHEPVLGTALTAMLVTMALAVGEARGPTTMAPGVPSKAAESVRED